jgi:hypothetical protein
VRAAIEMEKLHFEAAYTDDDSRISYDELLLLCIIASYIYVLNASVTHFFRHFCLVVASTASIICKATYLVFVSLMSPQCQELRGILFTLFLRFIKDVFRRFSYIHMVSNVTGTFIKHMN